MASTDEILKAARIKAELAKAYAKQTAPQLKATIKGMGLDDSGELYKSIKGKTKGRGGDVDRITFSMARHGIFAMRGTGRGYSMKNGKAGSGARPARDFYTPVIDETLPSLATQIAEVDANTVIRTMDFTGVKKIQL